MTDDTLLDDLLSKPVGPAIAQRKKVIEDFTSEVTISGGTATAEVRDLEGAVSEGTALKYLQEEGQNPDEWEVTGFRKIRYGQGMESVRFTYKRVQQAAGLALPLDELIAAVGDHQPVSARPVGTHGFLVLVGDMQFGKIDGDGPAGTLRRTVDCLNKAADALLAYRQLYDIGHVHIAWLGDHVEGFVSQNGANAWRTNGTLSEQIRLTRRVMLHALKTFAPLADEVTMAAVPGNHGETVRFEGSGVTRYDDSHDTESLIAVKDVADMMPEAFGHVRFFVPNTDELTVVTEVAGTVIAHHHGHKWRPNKHFEWWTGQAFNRDSNMHVADLLVAGHLHHEHVEENGSRLFAQVPSMEQESTWWRHKKGVAGSPGLLVAITKDGKTPIIHKVSPEVCK